MRQSTEELVEILWNYHKMHQTPEKSDVILALGSNDVRVAERAAFLYLKGLAPLIIFSGNRGRMTEGWTKTEAAVFAERAIAMGVPPKDILIEPNSTNTGENILFVKKLLAEKGLQPKSFIIVQKPYMERRALATFKKHFPEIQSVTVTSPDISFEEYETETKSREALIEALVGDTQRIPLYAEKGFMIPQEMPSEVWSSYEELVERGYNKYVM